MTSMSYEYNVQGSFCPCAGTPTLVASISVDVNLGGKGIQSYAITHELTCSRCQTSVKIPSTSVTANVNLGAP